MENYSIYIHFPWCESICPYCDFHRFTGYSLDRETLWCNRIISDFQAAADQYNLASRQLNSVFFGGGTPSLSSAHAIARIMTAVEQQLKQQDIPQSLSDIEISMEVNPNSVEQAKFADFFQCGVNRLSIGCQSFNPTHLKILKRKHNADQAVSAYFTAKQAGFTNINLDLIYGLPLQSLNEAIADAEKLIELSPEHISFYQLTIEPNSVFYKDTQIISQLPEVDDIIAMEQHIHRIFNQQGYDRYEVSAWSKPGLECAHNLQYWHFADYLALGPGASSKWSVKLPSGYSHTRWNNYKTIATWLEAIDNKTSFVKLDTPSAWCEILLNGLRLRQGINMQDSLAKIDYSQAQALADLQPFLAEQLLVVENGNLQATTKGYYLLDEILQQLLPD